MTEQHMNFKKLISTIFLLLISTTALAGGESGFYIGGSVGEASTVFDDDDTKIDDDDTSYKIFGGYNFGIIPLIDIAVEGAYMDFGEQTNGDAQLESEAVGIFGLVGFNLGPVGLFGKVGAVDWDTDLKFDNASNESDSGTDPAYGVGARFQLFSASIRAEYELFDLDGVDIDFYSVGVSYTF
jgi:hypothetical protein